MEKPEVENTEIHPQFPTLTSLPGNLNFTMHLEKGAGKLISRFLNVIIGNSMIIGVAVLLAIWTIFEFRNTQDAIDRASRANALAISRLNDEHKQELEKLRSAFIVEERQGRMMEYYIHEIDGKLIAAGFLKPSQNFSNFKSQHQEK